MFVNERGACNLDTSRHFQRSWTGDRCNENTVDWLEMMGGHTRLTRGVARTQD